jgi:hypothetical protein
MSPLLVQRGDCPSYSKAWEASMEIEIRCSDFEFAVYMNCTGGAFAGRHTNGESFTARQSALLWQWAQNIFLIGPPILIDGSICVFN